MKVLFKYITVLAFALLFINKVDAASITSNAGTGNWNSTSTWVGGVVPTSTDDVVIASGATVNLNVTTTVASMSFLSSASSNSTLNLNGYTLTVTGAVTIPRPSSSINTLNIGTGTLSAASVLFNSSGTSVRHQITISTGTLNVSGDITIDVSSNTSPSIIFSGAGTLNIGGALFTAGSGGTLTTFTSSTINYNGFNQTIKNVTYNGNLTLSGSGTKTFSAATTIKGDLSIASGVTAALGTGLTHLLTGTLYFNSVAQTAGKWGYGSPATSTNTTYFANNTGVISNTPFITNTWTGTTNTDWGTATNWSKGFVPTSSNTDSVVIANISGKQPIINSTVSIASMSIATGATLSVQGTNSLSISGNLNNSGTLSGTSSTIAFTGAAQTITSSALTFFNLTLSGTGAKTFTNGPTVNGTLTMGGSTATMSISSGSLTYGTSAGLLYNKTTAFTATSTEFKSTGTGGITIGGTGAITQQSSSVTLSNTVLTINSGAIFKFYTGNSTRNFTTGSNVNNNGTLNFGSKTVTFNADLTNTGTINGSAGTIIFAGNFSNTGSFTGNSGPITISGTGTQSIGGFTTTGSLTINKTGGTATFTGPVNGANLSLTGSTGTLNLGNGLTHTFTGTWASSNGTTLNGGSSTINFTSSTVSGTISGTFTPSTGTVGFTASAAQTVPVTTYNNLTIGGTSTKTFATTPTVNGTLSMEGTTASVVVTTGVVTYGGAATLKYNKTAAYTATAEEWISPFAATGGIIIAGTSAITPPGAVQIGNSTNVPLTINSGATLSPGSNLLTLHGNFTNNGTLTSGAGGITFAGTISQTINGFSTTGNVSMTKTAGIATLTGNVNAANLSLSGNGGTLNLGTSLTHIFSGTYSSSTGSILNGGSSELQFTNATVAGNLSGTFTPATSTVTYSGTNQTVASLPYYNLKLTGSGTSTKTYSTTPFSVSNLTWVDSAKSVKISMSTGTYTTTYLEYNGNGKLAGTYGSSSSGANYQSSSLYAGSGKLNVNSTSGNHSSGILTQLITTFPGETYTAGSNSGTPTAVNAGTNTITIHAIDALYDNVTSYVGTKSLTVEEWDPTSNTLVNTSTQSISFTLGVATAQIPITQVGNKIIKIKDAGSYGVNSSVVAVLPGTASKLIISAQPTTATAGVAISPSIQITLQDAYSNTVTSTSKTVTLAIGTNPSSGSLSGTLTATTVNGIATFSNVSINKSGTAYTLTAAATGVSSATSSTFNINPSTATKLGFITEPSNGSAGLFLNPAPIVAVQDTYGNTVTSITDDITIAIGTNPSSGSLTGTLSVTTNNGVASFDDLSIDLTGTGYTLDATSAAAYTHKVSNTFNITSSAASQLAFTKSPIDTLAGKIIAPIVEVQDANGNIMTDGAFASSVITLSLSTGTGALTGTLSMTATNGVADFSTNPVFITTAGTNKILTAVATGLSSATSTSFNISAAAPTQLTINAGNAQTATSGAAVSIAPSVLLKDVYNNLVEGNTVSFSVTGGGGSISPATVASDASGIATATSWTLGTTAGTNTLTATTGALSVTFIATGTVGAASQISINAGNGQTAIAGAAVSTAPSVIVKDANNNPVSGVSVTFAVAGGGGTVTPTSVTTNASGIAAVTSWTLGTTAGNNTLTATISAGSATFTATGTAGTASKLVYTTQPTTATAGSSISPTIQVTLEDVNNNIVISDIRTITLRIGTNPGSGTISGTVSVSTISGVASFNNINIDKSGTGYTLIAAASGAAVTNATSSTFNINPAAASKLIFSIQPSAVAVEGINFDQQPIVTIQDRFSNNVTTGSVTVALSLSTGTLSGTTSVASSSGIATFSGLKIGTAGSYTMMASSGGLTSASSTSITVGAAGAISAGLTKYDASCAKLGSIEVQVVGGTAPIKFDWSDIPGTSNVENRVGLLAGTYTLTITDALGVSVVKTIAVGGDLSNCNGQTVCKSETASVFSTDPDPSNSSYTWSVLPTAGETITGNGTSSISVNWTAVPVGTYSVCVTANNVCGTSTQTCQTVYVKQPDILAFADPTCSGSNLNLHAYGAANYSWLGPNTFSSNSANPVIFNATSGTANGTYTLTATDINGCVASSAKTINFSVDALPSIDVSGVTTSADCTEAGTGTISLTTVTGGVSFTYAWSKIGSASYSSTSQNITALSTGGYIVNVTNEKGCSTHKNFSVTSAGGPTVSATNSNVACYNSASGTITLTVAAGSGTYSYTWINSAGTFSSTNKNLDHLPAGDYSVQVTDGNACKVSTDVTITQPVGPLSAEATLTNINCKNASTGQISLNVFGGTSSPSYYFAWVGAGTFSATTNPISSLAAGTYTVTITDGNSCPYTNSYTITQPAGVLSATAALTNINCFGGTTGIVNLTTSGGSTPYTYSWSKVADGTISETTEDLANLSAGTYTVTITDSKSCVLSPAGFVITQPTAALSIPIPSTTNVNCFGESNGAITLNVTGGTSTYTYAWSNGATTNALTNLSAGTFKVTVTDNNACTATGSYTITQPTVLALTTVAQNNNLCNGNAAGNIDITITGGTTPYTYAWTKTGDGTFSNTSQDISSLAIGDYKVAVTDINGCSLNQNYTITQPAVIAVTATVINNTCNASSNGSITTNVTGGTGSYTYSWSNGETTSAIANLLAGNYSVTITDVNNCTSVQSYTITEPTALATPTATTTNLTCNGSADGAISLTMSGGVSPYTYAWTGLSGSFSATSKDISSLAAGSYSVTVTDANGCTTSLTPSAITESAAISVSSSSTNISCFGQTNATITINSTGGTGTLTYLWNDASTEKNRTSLAAGTYNLTITDNNGCTKTLSPIIITQPTAALSLTQTKNNILCNGSTGSIENTVTGGTTPYTYAWTKTEDGTYSNTTKDISLLTAGTYNLVLTDNKGCTVSKSALITQPTAITASLTSNNLTCNGAADGSIITTISGGTSPYTYAWAGPGAYTATTKDISSLAVGTYSVTITDQNGCTTILTSNTLTQPAAYSIAATVESNVACFNGTGGSVKVVSSGGTAPFTYTWSNGISGTTQTALAAGLYKVSAVDASGCKAKDSVTITQPAKELKVYGNVTNTRACAGTASGKIDVEVDNAFGAVTYVWTGPTTIGNIKSPSNLAAGDYTLSITDSVGCTASMSKTIGTASTLKVSATGESKTCAAVNGSAYAVVSGGVVPYTYLWNTKDTTSSLKGINTGTYFVTVTDANGCSDTASTTLLAPICDVPIAVTDVFVSTNGKVLSNTIAINDLDSLFDLTQLSFQLLNAPGTEQGSIVTDLNGDFVFTPSANYNGVVNLKYIVSNPLNLSSKAAFRIYVSHMTITDTVVNSTCDAGGSINLTPHGGFPGYTYSWTGPDDFKSTARNVKALAPGDYEVSITDSVGANITQKYTIADNCVLVGNSTIYLSGTNAFTYNAAPQGPKTYVKHGSTGAVTIVYSGVASTTYATSSTFPSIPGTYKAIATVAADANNTGATSIEFLFTIDKAPLTITAYDVNAYYGDPISSVIKAGTYSITGFIGNDTDSVIKGKVSFITNFTDTTKAGAQEITITPVITSLSADNYTFKAVSGTVNILTVTAIRPLPPKVNNGKFIFGNLSNPKTIRSLVYEIPKSTIPVWCDVVTNLCDSVAPALPKIIGKYVFVLKSLDTTTKLYSAESVNDTVVIRPPAPTVMDSTYILGLAANPVYIALQVNGMAGSTINYFVNNTKQTASPKLPNALGTFNYTVTQTVNTIESDSSRFKINMLNANDLVHLQKLVDSGVLQANSTFNYTFTFLVSNLTNYPMTNVVLSDNLQNSVPITSDFNIVSNKSTGGLVAAANYNGSTSINLTDTASKVLANKVDTTHLIVNISPKGYVGNLINIANLKLQTKWGTLNMASSADTKLNETSKRPTPYTIKDLAIVIPEGFSPNHDGINDKFIVIKPYDVTIDLEVYNRWGNTVYRSKDYKNDWDGKGTDNFIGQDLTDGGYYYIIKANNYNGGTKIFNGYIIIQR